MISYMVMGDSHFVEVKPSDGFGWLEKADIIHVETAREAKLLRDKRAYGCEILCAPGYYVFDWDLDGFRSWDSVEQLHAEYGRIMRSIVR